jgi:hypothetical protein
MPKSRTTHTSFYKGARIRLIMKNGDVIVAKFIEKIGDRWLRTDRGDIPISEVRAANYYKPFPHER